MQSTPFFFAAMTIKLIHGVGLVTGVMICVFTMLSRLVLSHFLNVTESCLGTCCTMLIIVYLCKHTQLASYTLFYYNRIK